MATIETARLTLRLPEAADLEALAAVWGDPEVVRYIGGKPLTREQAWQRLQRNVGHWTLLGYGAFAVFERASGSYIGDVGIANFERDMQPSVGPFEAGWVLAAHTHGKGYASEAIRAALSFHDERFPSERVSCIIHADNEPSLRVASKAGFVERLRTTYQGDPTVLLDREATRVK